jgi:hypothetical protein
MNQLAPLYLFDIDGTLIRHVGDMRRQISTEPVDIAQYAKFFEDLYKMDAKIIFCTGRKESEREKVEKLLSDLKIQYDGLIMGCPRGPRVIVNDRKGDGSPTAAVLLSNRNEYQWAKFNPAEDVIYQCDEYWMQLLDSDNAYNIYKVHVHPGETFTYWLPQKGQTIITVLSGKCNTRKPEGTFHVWGSGDSILCHDSCIEIHNADFNQNLTLMATFSV